MQKTHKGKFTDRDHQRLDVAEIGTETGLERDSFNQNSLGRDGLTAREGEKDAKK